MGLKSQKMHSGFVNMYSSQGYQKAPMDTGGRKQTAPAFYINHQNEQTRTNEFNKSANLYGSAQTGIGFDKIHGLKSPPGAQRNTDNNFNKKK